MNQNRFFALITPLRVTDTGLREVMLQDGHFAYLAASEPDLAAVLIPVSLQTSRHLVLLCDDENGVRVAVVRNGDEELAYHYHSELYRPLCADGTPQTDLSPLPLSDLDEDLDLECVKNAVDLGLEAYGLPLTQDDLAAQLAVA